MPELQRNDMRITFALPGLDGLSGGLRVAAQYAAYLSGRGHQVTLAARRPLALPGKRLAVKRFLGLARTAPLSGNRGHFTGLDLPVVQLDDHRPVRPRDLPDADVIVSTWWTTAEWADGLPPEKGAHVHFIQDHEDFEDRLKERVRSVYRQHNHKIVVAGWLADVMAREYGRTAVVVPNGVDVGRFDAPPRDRRETPRIGFLSPTHPRKNVDLALAALERLHAARPDIGAVSFGVKERPASLPDWIAYERKPDQDRIPAIYASCDLWLFTSISEGFGLPLLEAMASRTPVIATAAGAAPDLVDGLNGKIVAPEPAAFAEAMLGFLEGDAARWRTASDAAWATAQRNSLSVAAAAFEAALARAAGARCRPVRAGGLSSGAIGIMSPRAGNGRR